MLSREDKKKVKAALAAFQCRLDGDVDQLVRDIAPCHDGELVVHEINHIRDAAQMLVSHLGMRLTQFAAPATTVHEDRGGRVVEEDGRKNNTKRSAAITRERWKDKEEEVVLELPAVTKIEGKWSASVSPSPYQKPTAATSSRTNASYRCGFDLGDEENAETARANFHPPVQHQPPRDELLSDRRKGSQSAAGADNDSSCSSSWSSSSRESSNIAESEWSEVEKEDGVDDLPLVISTSSLQPPSDRRPSQQQQLESDDETVRRSGAVARSISAPSSATHHAEMLAQTTSDNQEENDDLQPSAAGAASTSSISHEHRNFHQQRRAASATAITSRKFHENVSALSDIFEATTFRDNNTTKQEVATLGGSSSSSPLQPQSNLHWLPSPPPRRSQQQQQGRSKSVGGLPSAMMDEQLEEDCPIFRHRASFAIESAGWF